MGISSVVDKIYAKSNLKVNKFKKRENEKDSSYCPGIVLWCNLFYTKQELCFIASDRKPFCCSYVGNNICRNDFISNDNYYSNCCLQKIIQTNVIHCN